MWYHYIVITSLLIAWATGSECNCTWCPNSKVIKSHLMANRESVMLLAYYFIIFHVFTNVWQNVSIPAFLIFCQTALPCSTTNRKWVGLHICSPNNISFHELEGEFCYCVGWSQLIPWLTASKCTAPSILHQTVLSLHDPQNVSNTTVLC